MNNKEKLAQLRALMKKHKLDFYLIPGTDPHRNEYVPEHWQRRQFISGFTGSNGDVVVGLTEAFLWTDGRYTLQAKLEVDPSLFKIYEYQQGQAFHLRQFFKAHAHKKRVGVDPTTLSFALVEALNTSLDSVHGTLMFLHHHLIDEMWKERPPLKHTPAEVYPMEYAGLHAKDKLHALRQFMQKEDLNLIVLNELADIAWLFNLRASDFEFSPLLLAYALISLDDALLYVDPQSWTPEMQEYCSRYDIALLPYAQFYEDLSKIKKTIVGLSRQVNAFIPESLQANEIQYHQLPIAEARAVKNKAELEGMQAAHLQDGIALCSFLAWLEHHWQGLTEVTAAQKLLEFRKARPLFRSASFETIAAYKDHGAIVHYRPLPETAYPLSDDALFLLDSGGQYLGGTTDVTRTIHLGSPTAFEKECYTLVLKGQLALRHTHFPKGTRGEHLDALARQFLWQRGMNYAHGTGHGVGAFLNVHEGPIHISTGASTTALVPQMILSNEPGVYFEGQFGIRIENVCVVVPSPLSSTSAFEFYTLEDLTLVPYCRKLIDPQLLNAEEIQWINDYHQHVFKTLSPHLDPPTLAWLKAETKKL